MPNTPYMILNYHSSHQSNNENERVTASYPAVPFLDPDLRVDDIIRRIPYHPVSAPYPLLMALVGRRPSSGRCHYSPLCAGSCSSQQLYSGYILISPALTPFQLRHVCRARSADFLHVFWLSKLLT